MGVAAVLVPGSGASLAAEKWYLAGVYGEDEDHRRLIEAARARAAVASDADVRATVGALLDPQRRHDAYWLLAVLEERATPALESALSDPRFTTPQAAEYDGPLSQVLQLLKAVAPARLVPHLERLSRHPEPSVRRMATVALGETGRAEAVEALVRVLRSDDHWDRSAAMSGIRLAVRGGRASDEYRRGLFDAVAAVIEMKSIGGTDAPDALLALDRERAVRHLTSPERFHLGHPEIASLAKALADARVMISDDSVARLIDPIAFPPRGPQITVFCYGLKLLALGGHASAGERIERVLSLMPPRGSDRQAVRAAAAIRRDAAEAYLILNGVPDAYHVAIDAWSDAEDLAALPEPVRNYVAVQVLSNEVSNGSFAQYFFNSYGDDVRHASAGLDAVGAKRSARIVRDVMALFGRSGPSADQEERRQQLDAVSPQSVDELSDQYLDDPDNLQVLLARYVLKHRQHFLRQAR